MIESIRDNKTGGSMVGGKKDGEAYDRISKVVNEIAMQQSARKFGSVKKYSSFSVVGPSTSGLGKSTLKESALRESAKK